MNEYYPSIFPANILEQCENIYLKNKDEKVNMSREQLKVISHLNKKFNLSVLKC